MAGTLNGGVSFDQTRSLDDKIALETCAAVAGNVLGGPGTDNLTLEGSGQGTFDVGQLVDFETAEKDGDGHWTLTGTNTGIAAFTVNGGLLSVNGSMPNTAFTVSGGTLGGSGTIGAFTALSGAIVAPGNSIGTMTVNGNFTLNPDAIYQVEVNAAGQGDKVIVAGAVNLTGAVLQVLAENGNYARSTNYVIVDKISPGAVTGTFAKITTDLAFLVPSVVYDGGDGNDVVLTLSRRPTPPGPGPSPGPFSFCNVANSRNQCNVALALDDFPSDNQLFLDVLFQTAAGARQAFDALSGEVHATVSGVLADESRYVRDAILGRLTQASYARPGQVASLAAGGPQVASLDAQAMSLGSGAEPMALGYDDKSLSAPKTYGPGLTYWSNAFGLGGFRR